MSVISPNPGEMSPELIEALKAANSVAEMQEIQRAWLVEHGAERDRFSPDKLILDKFVAPDAAAGTGTVSRVVNVGGGKRLFTASSVPELERNIAEAIQTWEASGGDANAGTQRSTVQARDPKTGQFIDPTNPAVIADLRARLVRGEITSEEFIAAQPQLLDSVMKERYNIDPEKVQGERFTNGWADATEKFLNSEAGADWPGGDANKKIIGLKLAELGLIDAEDKVAALTTAYNELKIKGGLVENPALTTQREIGEATDFESLRQAAWKSAGARPSSFWSR
jgi:hypothetical protein